MKKDIRSVNIKDMEQVMKTYSEPKFRAEQVFGWLHNKGVKSFDDMKNISKALKEKLSEDYEIYNTEIIEKHVSKEDGTTKYLFKLNDGNIIEGVLMKYSYGNAACISTQVGCRMGCTFCASTLDGMERNLTSGEMASQIYEMAKDCGERVSSVVLMGSGEPFDNFDNFINFIDIINSPKGYNLGQRHITVSTCGIVDKIYELAKHKLQITLAISLHAPNDEIRVKTMPVSKAYPMAELLKACKYYANETKRRVTFEYALISGLNDSAECAKELSHKLKCIMCHVNLIPVNDVKERGYVKSGKQQISMFAEILASNGIEVTVRRKLGSDINAACGQLRKGHLDNLRQEAEK